jgi:hypothetical protein
MKKFFLAVLVSFVFLGSAFGQSSGPKDLVLVLDTSSSMSDYSEEVSDYLIGPFLQEFLNLGDTFHLISFADEPKLELSRRIRETGDVETIIARLLLMFPLVRYTDISSAVDYAEDYVSDLPGTRSKQVVFITDGKNNAVPGSENASLTDDEISALLSSGISSRFSAVGANVNYVKVPLSGVVPPSGQSPVSTAPINRPSSTVAETPVTQRPSTSTPAEQPSRNVPSSVQPETSAPVQNTLPEQTPPSIPPSSAVSQNTIPPVSNQDEGRGAQVPLNTNDNLALPADTSSNVDDYEPSLPLSENTDLAQQSSDNSLPAQPITSAENTDPIQDDDEIPVGRVPDQSSAEQETTRNTSSASAFSGNWLWLILLILLIALIIGLIIFFMSRRLHSSPGKTVYEASSYNTVPAEPDDSAKKNAEMLASYAAGQRKGSGTQSTYTYKGRINNDAPITGPLMLSLFVEDQNTAIGRRNIHTAKSGTTLTVGGGKSDFLMFLVPMPQHIAEIQFDGRNCTFIPKKAKYFPDIGSQSVPNCIGKTIRVISDKNYELYIRMERFQDPLLELNRLMNSISLPGLPDE